MAPRCFMALLVQWHTVNVLEPTVILECKDGAYEPIAAEDVIEI